MAQPVTPPAALDEPSGLGPVPDGFDRFEVEQFDEVVSELDGPAVAGDQHAFPAVAGVDDDGVVLPVDLADFERSVDAELGGRPHRTEPEALPGARGGGRAEREGPIP